MNKNSSLDWLKNALPDGEDELIRVQTDLDEKGDFGNQWVVVTRNRVIVRQNGAIADIRFPKLNWREPRRWWRCASGNSSEREADRSRSVFYDASAKVFGDHAGD